LYRELNREFSEAFDMAPITILVDGLKLLQSYQGTEALPFIESCQIDDAEVVCNK
jgi:hypothetical protein